jgi:hypothetical protein
MFLAYLKQSNFVSTKTNNNTIYDTTEILPDVERQLV